MPPLNSDLEKIMTFDTELQTYQKSLSTWLAEEGKQGKFVVILGEEVLGFYDTRNEALTEGYKKYGLEKSFFVQQIKPVQTVAFMTRFTPQGA